MKVLNSYDILIHIVDIARQKMCNNRESIWEREERKVIEVKEIVKQYGNHLAVDHLSFTVEKGQIYGFLGPNGAGKSTTMNIITGYLASNEGTVVINGHDILEEPEAAKKCIGYLPEQPPLYMDMTVMEYLRFAAELKGVQKSEQAEMLDDIIAMTYLEPVKERLIKNLSKGYKQRVGLAQALIGNPEILILDEPTVGLDPKQIIEIRSLIKELSKEHTVILSSHILSEVSALCDKIMIISNGKLVACDTPENLSRSMEGTITLELCVKDEKHIVESLLKKHFWNKVSIESEMGQKDKVESVSKEMTQEAEKENLNSLENGDTEDSVEQKPAQKENKGRSNIWRGTIRVEGGRDIREQLFYLLADAKCPILEMKQSKMSLEDIFLELTEDKKSVRKMRSKTVKGKKREEIADESNL